MPGGDRTGPRGMGPMTGRRAGYCAGYDTPGYANPMWGWGGRGGAWGGRGGRGYRNMYYATGMPGWMRAGYAAGYGPAWGPPPAGVPWGAPPVAPEQEMEMLRQQAEDLKQALADIEKRLEELTPEDDK